MSLRHLPACSWVFLLLALCAGELLNDDLDLFSKDEMLMLFGSGSGLAGSTHPQLGLESGQL